MRLRKIREIAESTLPDLTLSGKVKNANPTRTWEVENAETVSEMLKRLESIGVFQNVLEPLKKLPFYSYSGNSLILNDAEYRNGSALLTNLKNTIRNLIASINQTIDEKSDLVISIKIPPPQNFEDLEKTSQKLKHIFSQTILNSSINGSVKIVSFDSGSYWIDILANSAYTVNVIGGLAYSAVLVYKKLQEGLLLKEQVRERKISNDFLQELEEKNKEVINNVAEQEAEYIYRKYYKETNDDPEQVARIKNALKELGELYRKGAEIHPSLNAKNEIKESFPDYNKIELLESRIEKLEAKKSKGSKNK